ncbi:hypothetical protein L1281_002378 [Neisseria sp. HSC-16F19]|nr:PhaM family polyhydroxyalkanoate granule multifunctional regulatory protein [Neisseria sp. HSC-16F19]MCP2041762.1 hypothetical protein [Neisseria sp. HSC-16F19]
MNDSNNPFAIWQQFWQQTPAHNLPFLPPTNLAEVEKRLAELDSVEMWLNFQLQAVQAQKALLAQQKTLFESFGGTE